MSELTESARAHQATEPDEAEVLRRLYGDPNEDGIYEGEAL